MLARVFGMADAILAETLESERAALFDSSGRLKLTPLRERLGEAYSFDELRLARLFLLNPK